MDGERWSIRINESSEEEIYSLLVDGALVERFNDWPEGWQRPVSDAMSHGGRSPGDHVKPARLARKGGLGDRLLASAERRDQRALHRALAGAERIGKEAFDLAQVEALMGKAPGSLAPLERSLHHSYYVRYEELRSLAKFADALLQLERE